jgi:ubiquinone/menaquinone biosynthesis C-methylase UbiE
MNSILIKIYMKFCSTIPGFRKVTAKFMYQVMGRYLKQDDWTYMNYGFSALNANDNVPDLDINDESNRLSFQLYHHLAAEVDLQNKAILEIGSGRGGGASMINKYHKPEKIVGLDYSGQAIKLCKKKHKQDGLTFVKGDAENLPFGKESFDAVINVESSHCYVSMKQFLQEVKKVLRPGGHFLYTDFRSSDEIKNLESHISESGMKIIKKRDITPNVVKALNEDHDRRMKVISENVPRFFVKQFREFAGVRNSVVYKEFVKRECIYFSYILQKR